MFITTGIASAKDDLNSRLKFQISLGIHQAMARAMAGSGKTQGHIK
jgi:hypothetical protein